MGFEPIPKIRFQASALDHSDTPTIGHADSQRNKANYGVIILNMLKEKSFFCQSCEMVFLQLLIVSC